MSCEICNGTGTFSQEHPFGDTVATETLSCPCGGVISPLDWNNGTIPKIAESIYQRRAFDEMPVLADALEDAGCDCEEMVMHCRGFERCWNCIEMPGNSGGNECLENQCQDGWRPLSGPHCKGCWVLDCLTGRR